MTRNMLELDPPDHTRLRALVQKAFTPRLVEQLRPRIMQLCDELLTRAAASGRIELVSEYALPLPMAIIAELLGIPPSDRRRYHGWSSRMVSVSQPRDALLALPAAWDVPALPATPVCGPPCSARQRPADRASSGRRGGRSPEPGRAARDGRAVAHRRPRDDRQSHRQRHARLIGAS
jgi:cytochrome P450